MLLNEVKKRKSRSVAIPRKATRMENIKDVFYFAILFSAITVLPNSFHTDSEKLDILRGHAERATEILSKSGVADLKVNNALIERFRFRISEKNNVEIRKRLAGDGKHDIIVDLPENAHLLSREELAHRIRQAAK